MLYDYSLAGECAKTLKEEVCLVKQLVRRHMVCTKVPTSKDMTCLNWREMIADEQRVVE